MSYQKLFNNYFSTYTSQTGGAAPAAPAPFDLTAWWKQQMLGKPKRGTPEQMFEVARQDDKKKITGNDAAQAAQAQLMGMSTLKNVPQPNYNPAVYLTKKDGNLQKKKLAWETGLPQRTLKELERAQELERR